MECSSTAVHQGSLATIGHFRRTSDWGTGAALYCGVPRAALAELAHSRVVFAAVSGHPYGQPDFVTSRRPIHPLQYEVHIEPELQFTDDHD